MWSFDWARDYNIRTRFDLHGPRFEVIQILYFCFLADATSSTFSVLFIGFKISGIVRVYLPHVYIVYGYTRRTENKAIHRFSH